MSWSKSLRSLTIWSCAGLVLCGGCGQPAPTAPQAGSSAPQTAPPTSAELSATDGNVAPPARRHTASVRLGSSSAGSEAAANPANDAERIDSVMAALRPLQILLGRWNGTSRKAVLDQPEWVWDLTTDARQPALVLKSDKGTYIREGRLTFLTASQEYEFSVTDGEGHQKVYRGNFSKPVEDVLGDDKKLQRTYKLELTEAAPQGAGEQWKIAIGQQENNRYIVEVDRKRGGGTFQRVDTVNTQREGTSFALSDTDYGEKTCLISQGLGTMTVSYEGKSYWVCCSGCKAAFEEDPKKWVAKWEAMQKKMKPN